MTNKNLFQVSFLIASHRLPTMLEVLTKEVSNLEVKSANGHAPAVTMKTPSPRKCTPRGSPSTDALRGWIEGMPHGHEFAVKDVVGFLANAGFTPTSSSPLLSRIMTEGKLIVSPSRGNYKRK